MSITPNVLATRYATAEMVAIFDPINKIIAERKFWITILKLQKKAGLPITDADISAYEKVIDKLKDSKTYKAKAWRMEKNKQFSKLYDQIEKAYKDGKITKIQYDKNMEKLLKDFSD